MGYVRASTQNPLGFRPWRAMLQPGGLGAFFPNAEAIGQPSVMIDRDAGNPGWKPGNVAPVPRIYYPPDAMLQFNTPRAQGLGAVLPTPIYKHITGPVIFDGWNAVSPQPVIVNSPGTLTKNNPPAAPTNYVPVFVTRKPVSTFEISEQPPVVPTIATATAPAPTAVTSSTTASGATVQQPVSGPPPANYPTGQAYTDPAGNVWTFQGSAGAED